MKFSTPVVVALQLAVVALALPHGAGQYSSTLLRKEI